MTETTANPDEVIARLGGVATTSQIVAIVPRSALERAVRDGRVIRLARGRYGLASADESLRIAHQMRGVLCLTSAAVHHGWAVKAVPDRPHLSFGRNRKLTAAQLQLIEAHRHDLHSDDVVDGIVTSKETTLIQCLRSLPDDEALAIADSAARAGESALLRRVAATSAGRGAARISRVAAAARPEAENPFESVLRSIALTVPGLSVEPQKLICSVEPWARPDLVDVEKRIVLEADSFAWHGDRAALRRDARRYDLLVADGWIVLRFAWEDVMFDQGFVRRILLAAVEVADRRTKVLCPTCLAA